RVEEQPWRKHTCPLPLRDARWFDLAPRRFFIDEIGRGAPKEPVLIVEVVFRAELVALVCLYRHLTQKIGLVIDVGRRRAIRAQDAEHLRVDVETAVGREEPSAVLPNRSAHVAVDVVDEVDRLPIGDATLPK